MNMHSIVACAPAPPETMEKKLLRYAIKSNWDEVINIYKNNPEAHKAQITPSGDTALHMAISDSQESTVEELVGMVENDALRIQNDVGNTPLHLAAYLGNLKMCSCIATRDPTLMGIRNEDKETPFFLAVLHGRKDAFLCLNSLCKNSQDRYGYCRRKDGETVLHAAIDGEFFDIAFHIIRDYENLLNSLDEKGFSPLHTLASKPDAFRSGSHIRGLIHQLIYHCTFVEGLKHHTLAEASGGIPFLLLRKLIGRKRKQWDVENPNDDRQHVEEQAHEGHGFLHLLKKSMAHLVMRAKYLITLVHITNVQYGLHARTAH
ncbi:hypothetical protein ACS0TY_012951 [Phlomoides rotata]